MLVDDHGRQVRIGIYGLAIDHRADPAILLTRLAADEVEAGYWTLPGGGLDWGEHPLEGLRREFIEETGLEPRVLSLLGIHSYSLTPEQRRNPGPAIQVIQAVYLVAAAGDLVHEVGGSTVEAKWFSLAELDSVPVVDLVKVALGFRDALRSR
ncbi:MAG TPA: NUDIX domain-containing protein [Acidimicrobiia bacterium]|nr:NUDIX domain-containing protein [Acidimicrobiia bacterium]